MSVRDNQFYAKENFMTTSKTVLKAANYTEAQTVAIVDAYKAGTSLEDIAKSVSKSVPSVRAKLASLKVYVAKSATKAEKIGGSKVNKDGLKAYLESLVGRELLNVESTSKEALVVLINAIKSRDEKIAALIADMLGDETSDSSDV